MSFRIESAYDLEDACFKLYCDGMIFEDIVKKEIIEKQHEICKKEAFHAFEHHPQLGKLKSQLVAAAKTSLTMRINQEYKRICAINEDKEVCLDFETKIRLQEASISRDKQTLDKLKLQNEILDKCIERNNKEIEDVTVQGDASKSETTEKNEKVESIQAQIDALIKESEELQAQEKQIQSRVDGTTQELVLWRGKQMKNLNWKSYYCYLPYCYGKGLDNDGEVYRKSTYSPTDSIVFTNPPRLEIRDSISEDSQVNGSTSANKGKKRYSERSIDTPNSPANQQIAKKPENSTIEPSNNRVVNDAINTTTDSVVSSDREQQNSYRTSTELKKQIRRKKRISRSSQDVQSNTKVHKAETVVIENKHDSIISRFSHIDFRFIDASEDASSVKSNQSAASSVHVQKKHSSTDKLENIPGASLSNDLLREMLEVLQHKQN